MLPYHLRDVTFCEVTTFSFLLSHNFIGDYDRAMTQSKLDNNEIFDWL